MECSGTEGTVSLNWGRWTMRAFPGQLAVRAEAADEESLRRIQELLTARLQKFGRREHLTVTWRRPGPARPRLSPEAEARATARSQDLYAERSARSSPGYGLAPARPGAASRRL